MTDERPRCKQPVTNPAYPIRSGMPMKDCDRLTPCKVHGPRPEVRGTLGRRIYEALEQTAKEERAAGRKSALTRLAVGRSSEAQRAAYQHERTHHPAAVPLTITTKVPSKWRMVDLETGDVWRWTEERGTWTRAIDVLVLMEAEA